MPYRELDDEARQRADAEVRAEENVSLRAAAGRERRKIALLVQPPERGDGGLAPFSEDPGSRAFSWSLGALAGIAGAMATLEHLAANWSSVSPAPPAAVVGLFCLLVGQRVGLWAAPSLLRLVSVPWLRQLPFPLRGYLAMHLLRRSPAAVLLRVEVPDADEDMAALVSDLVWQVDDATTVRREADVLVIRTDGHNRGRKAIQMWVREIADEVLVPLAAIRSVRAVSIAIQR